MFDSASTGEIEDKNDAILSKLLQLGRIKNFCSAALFTKNIIISGGTSTGKTTFTNTMIRGISKKRDLLLLKMLEKLN